ncbi:hypothetical protein CR513_21799, partial [Mucuna pruriens]
METLISHFTFFSSDQALQDKIFDPFTTEDLMKLFEIESYKAWVAVELEQEKEVEEAEVTMQQAEDHFDWVLESSMEEFRCFEEELERMSKAGMDSNSLIEAIASSKVHPS